MLCEILYRKEMNEWAKHWNKSRRLFSVYHFGMIIIYGNDSVLPPTDSGIGNHSAVSYGSF